MTSTKVSRTEVPRLRGLLEVMPLSLAQYERMIADGILGEDEPLELLEGYIIGIDRGGGPGMPPNPEHSSATARVNRRFTKALPDPWLVRCQDPIRLSPLDAPGAGTEPQPDVFVIRGPESRFDHRR